MRFHFVVSTALLAGTVTATPLAARHPSAASSAAASAAPTQLAGNPSAKPNIAPPAGFVGSLVVADTTVVRLKAVADAVAANQTSLKFDLNPAANPGVRAGAGGEVVVANRANFPLLTNLGIASAGLFFAPCGLNTPHTHPRATELFTVATNSSILTGFVAENGLVAAQNATLTQYQTTAFPVGSIHWQQNLGCEPAVGIGALSSEDPGSSSIAQNFFVNANGDIVQAALGYPEQISADNFARFKSQIPAPFVAGMRSCFQRCGFSY